MYVSLVKISGRSCTLQGKQLKASKYLFEKKDRVGVLFIAYLLYIYTLLVEYH